MKSNYAIFDESGNFSRFEDLDPAVLPPIPLAADGKPRAVPTAGPAPTLADGEALVYSRSGWVVIPAPDPSQMPVPTIVTKRQLRLALRAFGITTGTIESALAKIADAGKRADAAIEWQDASAYERDHPLIAQVGDACGLTSEQIDDLFRAAAKR